MSQAITRRFALAAVAFILFSLPVAVPAQEARSGEELRQDVEALKAEVAALRSTAPERVAELERRIDLLAEEIEKLRTGGAAEEASAAGRRGFAPAASKVYGISRGVSLGGYGEVLYENLAQDRQDDQPSGKKDQFDFLRQIVYVGYKFNDTILFNSEIEFEHASTGKGGEASVEFAYIDYQLSKSLGLRGGMVLVPMGFLNELHEPPIFHGAKRPDVEQAIVPSTWRENGAGIFGETGPVQWRAYVVAGLSSKGFSASGIRGGRQSGARSLAEELAFTARVDWTGVRGVLLGASVFTGETGQGQKVGEATLGARLTLAEAHVQYEYRGLQLRGLFAHSTLDDAAGVNAANTLTGAASVGEAQQGWYVQAAFDVMTLLRSPREWSLTPFVRYEKIDTQEGVPGGFTEDPATDRDLLTLGIGIRPIPQVALKADFARHENRAGTGTNQWNVALGYLF